MKIISSLAVALAATAVTASARAERPTARLTYVRGEGCPSEARFVESVAERLGYPPFAAQSDRALVVTVDAEPAKRRWAGKVTLTDAEGHVSGQRAIDSTKSCDDLATTAAFVVSVLLEPGGPPPSSPSPPSPSPPSPPPPAPLYPPPSTQDPIWPEEKPAPPPPIERPPLVAAAGLEGVVGGGLAPAPSIGGAIFGSITRAAFLLTIEARADLPASRSDIDPSARVWLAHGNVVPCYARAPFAVCAVVSAGAIWAEGRGTLATSRVGTAPYVAGGGRFEISLPLGDILFARAHADLVAPITRPKFSIGGERVYELPVLAVAGGVGIGARFR